MLVKILTEHGTKPTVVVWDAGSSGRKEVYPEYKATRSTRPDLLAEQWPHFEPLVEAFGYTNVRLAGFEADDVIATLAERAREQGIPVVIVTGDRDAFQLIDPRASSRSWRRRAGSPRPKLYDHPAVIDRYGIPPELIPDFYGLKGDTSRQHPRRPGDRRQDRRELLQTFGDLEGVLGVASTRSPAPSARRTSSNHAEDARVSKALATMQRDLPVDLDVAAEARAAQPDRSRLREVFREFELRDPLRRLEEFARRRRGGRARAGGRRDARRARVRAGRSPTSRGCRRASSRSPCARREVAEGELFAARADAGASRVAAADEVLAGDADDARGARRWRSATAGRRARREVARRRAAATSPTTRSSAPTSSSPRAAATRSRAAARSAACRRRSRTRPPPRRCWSARCRPGSASRSSTAACTASWTRSSCRSCTCCARWRSRACG